MKIYARFLSLFALAYLFWPQPASAMICPVQPTQDKVTCEIVICFRVGFPSSAGCRPALREAIKRVIWKRKSPIPWPTECMCSWFPQLLIPTTGDTLPFGLTPTSQGALEGFDNQTFFKAPPKVKKYRKYAQASPIPPTSGSNDFVRSYGDEAEPNTLDTPAVAPPRPRSTSETVRRAISQSGIDTNCTARSFRRGRSNSCYMRTADSMTTFNMRRVRRGLFGRSVTYYYDLVTRPYASGAPVSHTKMVFRNRTLLSCRLFVNGALQSSGECDRTSPYPGFGDDEVFDDSNYDENGALITPFDDDFNPDDNVVQR